MMFTVWESRRGLSVVNTGVLCASMGSSPVGYSNLVAAGPSPAVLRLYSWRRGMSERHARGLDSRARLGEDAGAGSFCEWTRFSAAVGCVAAGREEVVRARWRANQSRSI